MTEINQSKHPVLEINIVGSKDKNKVAAVAVINHDVFSVRLPNEATIFTVEAKALACMRKIFVKPVIRAITLRFSE